MTIYRLTIRHNNPWLEPHEQVEYSAYYSTREKAQQGQKDWLASEWRDSREVDDSWPTWDDMVSELDSTIDAITLDQPVE